MKKYTLFIGIAVLAGISIAVAIYNKPFQNITKAKPDVQISASELFTNYESDEAVADKEYLDKIIQVSGTVQEVKTENDATIIVLDGESMMFGISCELDPHTDHKRTDFKTGESITIKGKCTGKLMDVVLVRCVEVF